MKDQHRERWRAWSEKADALLEEIKRCREYRKIEDEMNKKIEEIYTEYIRLLKEGMEFLAGREKLKMGWRILKAKWENKVYRTKWILLKAGRLMLGMDV